MSDDVDAIIIGAGVIGAALALELTRKGYRTLNVDKLPAPGYGSTSNSCAIVRASYSTWDGVAMAYEGFGYWHDWTGYLGLGDHDEELARYVNCGTLQIKNRHDDRWQRVVALYDDVGVEYEHWDLDTLRSRVPIFSTGSFYPPKRPGDEGFWDDPDDRIIGAIHTPGSGYVNDPQLATRNLATAATAEGATFRYGVEVVDVRRTDGRVAGITLANGEQIDAPIVVNVAGPHSFVVNRMAGVDDEMNIGTRALRHEVHHVPAPSSYDYEHDGHHVSDGDAGIYFRPETANHILVGSEDPDCDPRIWVEDPDAYDTSVSHDQWEAQVMRLARRIPDLPIPSQPKGLVDLYDVSDDWIPIYDRSSLDGYYMAIGTSGNQFKNAGVVGYCMAELIDAVERGHDHDADPLRIDQRYTDLTLDMGFYSRNREINPNSSFSVNG
ncbi:MAG: FAD-dependent oxidoreductase [Acidimicrobiia bacterium]|nr:FAD-dependent oxidoreductase [Acidimicrobiia bacterium]